MLTSRRLMTCTQRVSYISGEARTRRCVIVYRALGVNATRARTRVHALIVDASLVPGAVIVHDALGSAARVRVSKIFIPTCARSRTVVLPAHRVGPARAGIARVSRYLHS